LANDRSFLSDVLKECATHSIETYVFGGWARELWGATPWTHSDIDLLVRGDGFRKVEDAIRILSHWQEIRLKRFPHKRAITVDGTMVEFILVSEDNNGITTDCFNRYSVRWPSDVFCFTRPLLGREVGIASPRALAVYHEVHDSVRAACRMYLAEQGNAPENHRAPR
jgi:hypothetical protein